MAESQATLVLKLKDMASSALDKFRGRIALLSTSVTAAVTALVGFTKAIISATRSYVESEQAVSRLNKALQNQGAYTKEVSEDLQAFAAQLQATSTFSDET